MRDEPRDQNTRHSNDHEGETIVDAIRHVGPTLAQEDRFLFEERGESQEGEFADGAETSTVNLGAVTADHDDREAEAMGAEALQTRLPGDTSSDPHTDVGPDNATTLDDERNRAA